MSNIQVTGGRLEFDDQPAGRKHLVSDIAVGLLFVSSLPAAVEAFVQPAFSAKDSRTPVTLAGRVKPFATLELSFLQDPKQGNSLNVSGSAGLRDFVRTETDGKPALNLPLLEVVLGALRYPARTWSSRLPPTWPSPSGSSPR